MTVKIKRNKAHVLNKALGYDNCIYLCFSSYSDVTSQSVTSQEPRDVIFTCFSSCWVVSLLLRSRPSRLSAPFSLLSSQVLLPSVHPCLPPLCSSVYLQPRFEPHVSVASSSHALLRSVVLFPWPFLSSSLSCFSFSPSLFSLFCSSFRKAFHQLLFKTHNH